MNNKMNDKEFKNTIELILEEIDPEMFGSASDVYDQLSSTKKSLSDVEANFTRELRKLNAMLAGAIQKAQPGLTVQLARDGSVGVGYHRSRSNKRLNFRPDIENRCWKTGDTPFEKRYKKYYGDNLGMGLEAMGTSIAQYFTKTYKSLEEDKEKGKLIVEDIDLEQYPRFSDTVISTGTVEGAGVVARLQSAFDELKIAKEFAQRCNMTDLADAINRIGIETAEVLTKLTGEDENEEQDNKIDAAYQGMV